MNYLRRLLNGEPFDSYLLKQVTGALLGILIASACGFGGKIYLHWAKSPTCSVAFVVKNSIGIQYDWTIKVRNTDVGSILIYPKSDVAIRLETLMRPDRVVESEEINLARDRRTARGLILKFIDGDQPTEIKFSTFSTRIFNVDNTKKATCSDLLVDL